MGDARSAVRLRELFVRECFILFVHLEFVELVFSSMDSFRDSLPSVLYVLMLLVKEPFLRFKTQPGTILVALLYSIPRSR